MPPGSSARRHFFDHDLVQVKGIEPVYADYSISDSKLMRNFIVTVLFFVSPWGDCSAN